MFYSQSFSPQPQPQQPQQQPLMHPQHSSSTFSSPVLSASASPYITPNAPTHSPAPASAFLSNEVGIGGGALTVGSKIRVRATEGLHPKLAPYAGQSAEIIELPAHPNTWFGIRLADGRQVKLRKTAFDVESLAPMSQHQQQQNQQQQILLAQKQQAQAQQQQYSLNAYPQNPFSHYHQQPLQQQPQQQQQYAPPLNTHHLQPPAQQYAYSSPSPIASPTLSPALSAITAPTQASSSSYTLPMSQLRLDPEASSASFDQPASAIKRGGGTATATPIMSQTNSPILTGQRTPKQQHTPRQHRREDAEDEAMSGTESAGSGTDDDALRRSRGASLTDDPEPGMVFGSASNRMTVPQPAATAEDEEDSEASDGAEDSDDDDEDDGGAQQSRKPSSSTKAPKSGASSSKQSRSRRGRGRALLGLNVVVVGGRYKGESGFVTKGANGYYSVQFHRPMPELRNLDNTAMKRSSELAPITAQGKRLMLPLAPAQRKVMKAEAAAATGVGAAASRLSKSDSAPASASASQSVSPTLTSHKRKSTFAVPSRKTAVYRRADSKRQQPLQQRGGHDSDSHSDCSSCRSDSGSDSYESDGQEDAGAGAPRSRGRPRTQAHNWHSHRRSHSNSSVSSSSSSSNALQGSPRTELLSPRSFPPSPSLTLTSSPSRAFALQMQLPSMSLGPTHFEHPRTAPSSGSKSASMRSQSPGVKKAASILVALSHQGEVAESPTPPPLHPPHVQQQQLHAQHLHAQQMQLQAHQHPQHQLYSHPQPHPMQHKPNTHAGPIAPGQLTYQLTHIPSSPHAHMMYAVAPQQHHQQMAHQQMEGTVWRPA